MRLLMPKIESMERVELRVIDAEIVVRLLDFQDTITQSNFLTRGLVDAESMQTHLQLSVSLWATKLEKFLIGRIMFGLKFMLMNSKDGYTLILVTLTLMSLLLTKKAGAKI